MNIFKKIFFWFFISTPCLDIETEKIIDDIEKLSNNEKQNKEN